MASLDQHETGVWRIRFRFGGKQFYRSLDTADEQDARAAKATIEETIRLLGRGILVLPPNATPDATWHFLVSGGKQTSLPTIPATTTLGDAVRAYLDAQAGSKEASSIVTEKIHTNHLLDILGKSAAIADIDTEKIQKYVDGRKNKVVRVTVEKVLQTASQLWQFARRRGWVHQDFPRDGVRLPKGTEREQFRTMAEIQDEIARRNLTADDEEERAALWETLYLTEPEVLELVKHVEKTARHPFILPMVAFAAFTGCRRSELVRSEVGDFRLDAGFVRIREKKRDKTKSITFRQVQVHPRLADIMRGWFDGGHPGGRYTLMRPANMARSRLKSADAAPITKHVASQHLERTLAGSKWSVVAGFHTFRHSFASIAASKGVSEAIIDGWLGHTTEEMRRRYRHLFPSQQQQAMDRLWVVADLFAGKG